MAYLGDVGVLSDANAALTKIRLGVFTTQQTWHHQLMQYFLVRADIDTSDIATIETVLAELNDVAVRVDAHIEAGHIGDVWNLDKPVGKIAAELWM